MVRALVIVMTIACVGGSPLRPQPRPLKRWPAKAAIGVWLEPRSATPGAGALVDRALATWTRAAAGRFVLEKASSEDAAAIRVRFAHADGIYGETTPRIDRATGLIGSAEVVIAADIPGDALQQRIVVYLTALHELGHALGLPHTDAFDDIMYAFRRPDDGSRYFGAYRSKLRTSEDIGADRAPGLSQADIAALHSLYDR
jgi:hypothetical protein